MGQGRAGDPPYRGQAGEGRVSLPDFTAEASRQGFIPQAAALWNHGLDTLAIAKRLERPEAEIYNRLALIKRCAKDMRA